MHLRNQSRKSVDSISDYDDRFLAATSTHSTHSGLTHSFELARWTAIVLAQLPKSSCWFSIARRLHPFVEDFIAINAEWSIVVVFNCLPTSTRSRELPKCCYWPFCTKDASAYGGWQRTGCYAVKSGSLILPPDFEDVRRAAKLKEKGKKEGQETATKKCRTATNKRARTRAV